MNECPRCGTRMAVNDETTKLEEFACPRCHALVIDRKQTTRGRV